MASDPLVELYPSDNTLMFSLSKDSEARAVLRVKNISQEKVVFKVKTTQPTWYYVRPNQHILDINHSEDVTIVLIESESNRCLDLAAINQHEKVEKHRFLVQSKVLSDDDFLKIKELPVGQRGDEYSRIWNSGEKDDKRNMKLKVEFIYPTLESVDTGEKRRVEGWDSNSKTDAGTLKSRVKETGNSISSPASGSYAARSNADPELIFGELLALRKKYDAVVEYTVHLTAERDTIVSQLEEVQREYSRELSRKRSPRELAGSAKKGVMSPNGERKRIVQKGFSLLALIFVALVFFLLGRYVKF